MKEIRCTVKNGYYTFRGHGRKIRRAMAKLQFEDGKKVYENRLISELLFDLDSVNYPDEIIFRFNETD